MADNANLTYGGNAVLGAGANADISVISPNNNLDLINKTAENIRAQNFQKNLHLFDQKVKDRDALIDLIERNQVVAGELDPQYRGVYDKAEQEQEKLFNEIKGNNDQQGIQKFLAATRNAKEIANHGQLNTIELKKLIKERDKKTLQKDIDLYDAHIAKEKEKIKNDYWEMVNPIQKPFDGTTESILGAVTYLKSSIPASEKTPYDAEISSFDFNGTSNKIKDLYIRDRDAAQDMRWLLDGYQDLPAADRTRDIQAMNNQIEKHNTDLGLVKGQPGYAEPIKYEPGIGAIQEMPADFAAKYALANQSEFTSKSVKPNIQFASLSQKRENDKANNAVKWYDATTKRMGVNLQKAKFEKELAPVNQIWDNLPQKIISSGAGIPFTNGIGAYTGGKFYIPASQVPEGFTNMQGIDEKGNPIKLSPINGNYEVKFTPRMGNNNSEILQKYQESKAVGYKGDLNQYFQDLIKKGVIDDKYIQGLVTNGQIDFELQGQSNIYDGEETVKGDDGVTTKRPKYRQEIRTANRASSLVSQLASKPKNETNNEADVLNQIIYGDQTDN